MKKTTTSRSIKTEKPCDDRWIAWLRVGLQIEGKTQLKLASALNIAPSGVTKILRGDRKLQIDEIALAATYFGIDPPPLLLGRGRQVIVHPARIVGDISDGVWHEPEAIKRPAGGTMPFVTDERFAGLQHYSVRVNGDAGSGVIPDGFYAVYVPYHDARPEPSDGDVVVFTQTRKKLVRRSIRKLFSEKKMIVLRSLNTDSRVPDIEFDRTGKDRKTGDVIEVVGLVVWRGAPMPI